MLNAQAPDTEARPPNFSDESLALRFAELHVPDLRYVAQFGQWLEWNGARWSFDNTLHAFDQARAICREAAKSCNKKSAAMALASAKTVAAVERLAKADRRLAATAAQWDIDPWLLNTPAGGIDLHTGKVYPHRSDHYLTKITSVAPGGACPIFHTFLDRITAGDAALANYLQRLFGYALTGITREHALAFLYRTGANGKSVLLVLSLVSLATTIPRPPSKPSPPRMQSAILPISLA